MASVLHCFHPSLLTTHCLTRSANIANTLIKAIADAPNAVTLGIASRSIESATAWGAERGVPKAYGSYRESTLT